MLGACVTAKATAVRSHAECKRLFGSLWKVKSVKGVVKDAVKDSSGKRQQTSCGHVLVKPACVPVVGVVKLGEQPNVENHQRGSAKLVVE